MIAPTFLYANDMAVFVFLMKEDIACLASILTTFGDVIGLCATLKKV
jgi:hypothetical protein